jgi:16S rRNA (guanine527-N7)-methyltransferase
MKVLSGMSFADKDRALRLVPVSRETSARLDILAEQVRRWQPVKNIISNQTLDSIWTRHIADSLQLASLVDQPRRWVDLGSGGGFPGLALAATFGPERPCVIEMVESNGRKCAFLRETARRMGVSVVVHHARIEDVIDRFVGVTDVVSARALADLPQLVTWCEKLLTNGAIALFPKGKDAADELTETAKYWRLNYTIHNSLTDPAARILRITQAIRLSPPKAEPQADIHHG